MTSTSTVVYLRTEPAMAVRLHVPASASYNDIVEAVAHQLSSPPQSYTVTAEQENIVFRHKHSYRTQLKSAKESIDELREEIDNLKEWKWVTKEKEKEKEKTLIDWEVKTRIAQGLNDIIRKVVPEETMSRLKAERLGFFPPSLTTWAAYNKFYIPAFDDISDEEYNNFSEKASRIKDVGLYHDIEFIWESLSDDQRLLMVNMWASRPDTRRGISHPQPTTEDGERLVESNPRLTPAEKDLAKEIIYTAVDNNGKPLFKPVD